MQLLRERALDEIIISCKLQGRNYHRGNRGMAKFLSRLALLLPQYSTFPRYGPETMNSNLLHS